MSQCAGPVTITAERFTTFTRYRCSCACGWSDTSRTDLPALAIVMHLRRCPAVSAPSSGSSARPRSR